MKRRNEPITIYPLESSHFEEKDGNIHYIKTLQDFVDKKQKIEEGEYRIVHISE